MLVLTFTTNSIAGESTKEARIYASKIFKLSTESIRFENMVSSLVGAGYSKEESEKYASITMLRLQSEEYIRKIENIYIKEFSVDELKQISEMLEYPVFKKFLDKRVVIQGKMMKILNKLPSNN